MICQTMKITAVRVLKERFLVKERWKIVLYCQNQRYSLIYSCYLAKKLIRKEYENFMEINLFLFKWKILFFYLIYKLKNISIDGKKYNFPADLIL